MDIGVNPQLNNPELSSVDPQASNRDATFVDLQLPSRALCTTCRRAMPLRRDGNIRSHGPVKDRCKGSGKPPLPEPVGSSLTPPAVNQPAAPEPLASIYPRPKLLRRIPRGSRESSAIRFSTILENIVSDNSVASWNRLFLFPSRCLRVPARGGHRRSLASQVNTTIREERDFHHSPIKNHSPQSKGNCLQTLAPRVAAKLEEGDFRGAVRIASSVESFAPYNGESLEALKHKHPAPHPNSVMPPQPTADQSLQVDSVEVARAIQSFPCGSAGGPDGLRPQHLKDMIGQSAGSGAPRLLRALTSFVNLVLEGSTAPSARPLFFGASLVALNKPGGGVRPIAIGCTLRRLASKCAGSHIAEAMGATLAPLQLGYGTPLGAEAVVHAARRFLHNLQPDHLILKLDFENAFNSIRRDKMLTAVRERAPEIYPLVHSAYSAHSALFFGGESLQSAEGIQQGDPLGPLLFCLTVHDTILDLHSTFRAFYLDDGTLGGSVEEVLQDLAFVERAAAELGLHLNHDKSELICTNSSTREAVLSVAPRLRPVDSGAATLLGSPIGSATEVDNTIRSKREFLKVMGDRLQYLHPHDALCLLRHAFALPKMLYVLRTSPCFLSSELENFDLLLRSLLGSITNLNLLDNDAAWTQASLPVWSGGLGIRSVTQLAPSAFLASAAGSSSLVSQLLPSTLRLVPDPFQSDAIVLWKARHDEAPPTGTASTQQKSWDTPVVNAAFNRLLESAPDERSQARLRAAQRKESGAWLNALPLSAIGLRMDGETIRIAMGLRLGVPLCLPHMCQHCGSEVDSLGTHGLSCYKSQGRHPRHASVNGLIQRHLSAAGIPAHLEPSGVCRSDGKRPDGASIMPWSRGRTLVWDVTCPDTFAPSHVRLASGEAGLVAAQAEQRKNRKYAELLASHHFTPVAVETSGVFGPEAASFFKDLGHRLRLQSGDILSYSHLVQQVAVAVQRGNAAAVLGTVGRVPDS